MLFYDWLTDTASDGRSDKALVYRDTYLSWRGLIHRVDRRAQELYAMGVGKGAWVGLMLGNVPDMTILALALSKLEAVVVPLDPTTGNRDLEMVLEAAPLRALVTRPRGGETGQSAAAAAANPLSTRLPLAPIRTGPPSKFAPESRRRLQGTLLTCSLYKRSVPEPLAAARPAVVLFTADVGGDPKGVLRTEKQLKAISHSLTSSLGMEPADRLLCTVPLHHSYGFDFGFLATLAQGATLFLEDEVSPKRIAKLLRDHDVDIFPGTPGLYGSLIRVPTVKPLRIAGARYLSSGSRLPTSVSDGFAQRFGIKLLSVYHTTATGPVAIDRAGREPASVGKAFKNVDVRVASGDGGRMPAGETGPVWVRSPGLSNVSVPKIHLPSRGNGVPLGGMDEAGWYRTGDLGALDKTGKLTLLGREDDLVKVDGKRVALGEVEGCLEAFPKVKAAQALVVMDDLGGPMVVARVVRLGTCRAEELIDHCAKNLAPYKVPRQIEFCEALA